MENAPVPNILRPVAGIKIEICSFEHKIVQFLFKHLLRYLCSILNTILAHVILKLF